MVASHVSPLGDCHLLYDLFNVFICSFDNTFHLWLIRGRIMMLNLELLAHCGDHSVVKVRTIVYDDPLRNIIPTYEILLDELDDNILGNGSERSRLNPLYEIVNGHQDEVVSIRGCWLDFPNHIDAPHRKGPRIRQYIQRNQRYVYFVSIDLTLMEGSRVLIAICFHGRPVIACP